MRFFIGAFLVSLSGICCACSTPEHQTYGPDAFNPFLGMLEPGDTAVLFAPGLVSVEGRYEYGVSFSPDGRELLFTGQIPDGAAILNHFSVGDTGWVGPREVHLSEGARSEEMEAFFTPDGRRIHFAAYDEGMDVRIWVVDRDSAGWSSPRQLGEPVANDPAFFPTTTSDGFIYYSNLAVRRIFRATISGDSVVGTEDTGLEAMHAFIAPDESFVLLDARSDGEGSDPDIFVSFRQPDGAWSQLMDLGPGVNTEYSETCPSLSHDGRFIFFGRYNEPNSLSNIYWVSSTVVDAARERLDAEG